MRNGITTKQANIIKKKLLHGFYNRFFNYQGIIMSVYGFSAVPNAKLIYEIDLRDVEIKKPTIAQIQEA
jgi:hypothetical protein